MQEFSGRFWTRRDWFYIFLLLFWTAALNGYKLGELEFFRHTEADRTLIAWEMVESGDFLVPKLLGSQILTKPPLYYWLSASAISFFGEVNVWVARTPSYVFSIFLVILQYIFLKVFGATRFQSLTGSFLLSTSFSFFVIGTLAEIDLVFCFFCSAALYAGGLSVRDKSLRWALFGYLAAALAFLTKGPPIVFFYAASVSLFYVFSVFPNWQSGRAGRREVRASFGTFIFHNVLGSVAFLALVLCWIIPLAKHVGWSLLYEQFRVEILERIVAESGRDRGVFFYATHFIAALLPWSLFILVALLKWFSKFRKRSDEIPSNETLDDLSLSNKALPDSLFLYSLIVVLSGIVMLTLAEGKSSRYLFPVHLFGVNLCLYALYAARGESLERKLLIAGKWFGLVGLLVSGLAPLFFHLEVIQIKGVSLAALSHSAIVLGIAFLLLTLSCQFNKKVLAVASLGILMFGLRFGQTEVFVPHRNYTRSVLPIAEKLASAIPAGEPYYTLELFERWTSYYLKLYSRQSIRLTPELALEFAREQRSIYLLLSFEEEAWRIVEVLLYDPEAKLMGIFEHGKDKLYVVKVHSRALPKLYLRNSFPTDSSIPFLKQFNDLIGLRTG